MNSQKELENLSQNVRKLEGNVFSSEFFVDCGVGPDLVLHLRLLRLVEEDCGESRIRRMR
jgi:hypothetical protein